VSNSGEAARFQDREAARCVYLMVAGIVDTDSFAPPRDVANDPGEHRQDKETGIGPDDGIIEMIQRFAFASRGNFGALQKLLDPIRVSLNEVVDLMTGLRKSEQSQDW
jgi:hypothetical protein